MADFNKNTHSSAGAPLRIIVAGGGTGGHIFPAIAIANAIKKTRPDTQFLFVGAKGKMEMEKVPQAGFNIEGLDIAGFQQRFFIQKYFAALQAGEKLLAGK